MLNDLLVPLMLVCPKGLKPLTTGISTIHLSAIDYLWYTNIPHPATVTHAPIVTSTNTDDDELVLNRRIGRAEDKIELGQVQDLPLDRVGQSDHHVENAENQKEQGQAQ